MSTLQFSSRFSNFRSMLIKLKVRPHLFTHLPVMRFDAEFVNLFSNTQTRSRDSALDISESLY